MHKVGELGKKNRAFWEIGQRKGVDVRELGGKVGR